MLEKGVAHDQPHISAVVEMEIFVTIQPHLSERHIEAGIHRNALVEGELDAGSPHKTKACPAIPGVQLLHPCPWHVCLPSINIQQIVSLVFDNSIETLHSHEVKLCP